MDERTPMQSPTRAAAATQRENELQLLREAVQRLEQGPTFNKQIQERPEEKCTLNKEIQDLKDMLEVKERKVNDLQNGMENLQEQLRDKEKQMGSLKGRIKSLQADTSNTDSTLTRLVESVAEKEHIIQRLKEQRFQDDQGKGEELVASRTMLEKMKVEHKMALEETAARHEAQSMDWLREREALKAHLLGLMKELEENRQVAQQLSFNVGPQPQPIETRQDRRGTAPPGRAAQPRRRFRKVERRDRIRQFQEREDREHLIRKRNWLEVEKRRLDAECMELQFLERERQRIRFERRRERYGRERVELRRQQEQLRFGQDYRSGKRSYRFQGGHWPGRTNANTLSSHDPGCWSVRGAPSLHQSVEECGNPSQSQRPWRPRGQVVEAVYHRFSTDGASKNIGAN
ncbi:ELKS/Rab6-interacting/CAST family member 1-like [Gadus chalcogrammus]|uniref:ELKS/Rab6-interacting/CAST family member 1-like n=1 Tax=Gadus chalcogrammus TaxID=1042646 RepID=UPI0024C496F2|nr:ELKS/Rab6-interacting/CAST family member 1-like [Gadus chalcogrammus]XP_056436541.1 ELKS/Rab6-interacting/CAST family member 1-like [Gadus chalcogrammus]XP_056436543.1 ELKS/Rab6-interacting/CAST family member 1-like [Gadus chalcogrammus]XP_056436544.1 ELKS/Rab6-interacting/CAST family member 1-like [Gadus chalcogrammus]